MLFTALKAAIAASVIIFASWLAGKKPELAGFITALPLVSIMAIAFSYTQHDDVGNTVQYARSIIFAVPISWLFFVPFFFTEKFNLGFWPSWALGLALLAAGYFLHQWILKQI
ncbi:MAG TPA: hypothetical protein DIU06_03030 [Rhodospirillaceae bacterium]|nr:hypothetical protein [Rhodospirillaceae bacterium]|tara:strand:- start:7056 stop:7394 length:339 start_codon:yes stop_codon:yes gene_type:complete